MAYTIKDSGTTTGTGNQTFGHLNNLSDGDTSIVLISTNQSSANRVSSVTDSGGNIYARAGTGYAGTNISTELWYCINAKLSNTTTLTVAFTTGTDVWAGVWSIVGGLGISAVIDKQAGSSGTAGTSADSTVTAATTLGNEFVIGGFGQANNRPFSAGTGYTSASQAANGTSAAAFLEYKSVTSTGTYNATATWDLSSNWVGGVWTIKEYPATGTIYPLAVDTRSQSGTTNTTSLTLSAYTDFLIVGFANYDSTLVNRSISSVTWNGVALTKLRGDEVALAIGQRSEIWYLIAPATGTNNLVYTTGGGTPFIDWGAFSFIGVHQTTPINASGTNTTSAGASISCSLTTTVANTYIMDVSSLGIGPAVANSGQILRWSQSGATSVGSTLGLNATAGTFTTGYSDGKSNEDWVISSVAIAPVSGGGGGGAVKPSLQLMGIGA